MIITVFPELPSLYTVDFFEHQYQFKVIRSFVWASVALLKIWQHSSILEKKNGNHMATIWRPTGIRQFLDVAAVVLKLECQHVGIR